MWTLNCENDSRSRNDHENVSAALWLLQQTSLPQLFVATFCRTIPIRDRGSRDFQTSSTCSTGFVAHHIRAAAVGAAMSVPAPLRANFSPLELEFVAEETLVEIIPSIALPQTRLLSGVRRNKTHMRRGKAKMLMR
jgi:hypothetical protein